MGQGPMTCLRVVISGRVQGVWFRGWCVEEARARGLDGWVRNWRDGTVEAVFVGPPEAVEAMATVCGQGPPGSRVTKVERFSHRDPVTPGFDWRPSVDPY